MKTLELSQGLTAVVDDDDYAWASQYKWTALVRPTTSYAYRTLIRAGRPTTQGLHRALLRLEDPAVHVDHINGDGLDNRRANLRIATIAENNRNQRPGRRNRSGFKGVYFRPDRGRWVARIFAEGQVHSLGHYDSAVDAAHAYDAAAKELHGEFAYLNFPLHPQYSSQPQNDQTEGQAA